MTLLNQLKAAAVVSAVAVTAFSVVGCGGGNDTTAEATAAPLTKSQFIKRAEGICQRGLEKKDEQIQATAERVGTTVLAGSPKELRKLAEVALIPAYTGLITELKALNPPSEDRATVAKILDEYDAALQATEKEPLLVAQKNPFTPPDEAAASYGIANCRL
jgi:hypothetical protein